MVTLRGRAGTEESPGRGIRGIFMTSSEGQGPEYDLRNTAESSRVRAGGRSGWPAPLGQGPAG